ncbi:nuclear transport factor 2 family protein [Polymorphobacter sp.]|uniref:nuclear transport factor 2 family protein n=1 Tax=Polymorphobacter sp. TaxID=1909290 RepID=UPI003F6EAE1B
MTIDLPARTALLLDKRDFDAFLRLCTPDFQYRVQVWSPEIRRQMLWFDHDRAGLKALFEALPEHVLRPDQMLRHLGQSVIDLDGDNAARIDTSLTVFMTGPDGQSRLWAVGRYEDRAVRLDGQWHLAERTTRLQTRDLGIGTHVPI